MLDHFTLKVRDYDRAKAFYTGQLGLELRADTPLYPGAPSRWDKFLAGDTTALTAEEKAGLRTYLNTGCQACHVGAYIGGDRFMKAGAQVAWFSQADSGRFGVTKDAKDLFVFKVPSLRNIDRTGPYFHDGSVASLNDAVRLMAHHQLNKELPPADVQSIVTWMGSLTGDLNTDYIAFPQQPKK